MTLALSPGDEALVLGAPMFVEIDRESLLNLLDAATVTNHAEGGLLFSHGDPADRFFLVLAGRINLFALTETGDQSIIEVVDKGNTFAEAAIFASARFPLNAQMAPGTRLLEIPAQTFIRRLSEEPELVAQLLASLARWQRRLIGEIADLKSRSPVQRLGLCLLALAESTGGSGAKVNLPLTKSELASRIGITPESLSRAMGRLRPLGVSTHGREFIIADTAVLRQFCGAD